MEKKESGQCTLCLKTSSNTLTKQLSCDHLFCAFCSVKIRQSKISCPKCREAMPTPSTNKDEEEEEGIYSEVKEGVQPNHILDAANNYVKANGSEGSNDGVPFYVNTQRKENATSKDTKESDAKQIYIRSCSSHNQKTEFFCHSCETATCSKCLLTSHPLKTHEIISLDDFIAEKVNEHYGRVDEVEEGLGGIVSRINDAKDNCKKDQETLEHLVKSKQTELIKKVGMVVEKLLQDLKIKGNITLKSIAQLDSRRATLVEGIDITRKICKRALDPTSSVGSKEKAMPVENIIARIHQLEEECKSLKGMEIPSDLNLKYQENPAADITLGMLVLGRPVDDGDYYDSQIRISQGWKLKKEMAVGNDEVDFVNIVCMDEDWIIHVSNHYGSGTITIKHYSVSSEQECRQQFVVDTGTSSWTIAKTAGHDRSILVALGDTVRRISFRRKNTEHVQTIATSVRIEAITWDEYGVDCYILATNRRDVYWVSMNGEVNYLCAFQTDVQSVASISVNEKLVVTLLDRTAQTFHRRDCLTSDSNTKLGVSPPMPDKFENRVKSLRPYIMASTEQPGYHFVLFNGGKILAIGQFDQEFRFIDWVMSTEISSSPNIIDMSVRRGTVYLLCEERISIYNVPVDNDN